jgi:hypothetical protein
MSEKLEISREQLSRWVRMAEVFDDGGDGADPESARTLAQEMRALLALPVVDRQEPIIIESVAVVRDGEDGLYLEWTVEGGIDALELAGTVLFASNDGNDMCAEDGSCEVYLEPPAQDSDQQNTALTVWYGSMPESNGKTNWTAILHRKDGSFMDDAGICVDRSEYPDRVRYEADRMRYLIGELPDEPDILEYNDKLHSGYVGDGE